MMLNSIKKKIDEGTKLLPDSDKFLRDKNGSQERMKDMKKERDQKAIRDKETRLELLEFKKKHSSILPAGNIGGNKKQKVKDMSLASQSNNTKETKQNRRVLNRLLFEASEMKAKVNDLGDDLTKLLKKYFGSDKERK